MAVTHLNLREENPQSPYFNDILLPQVSPIPSDDHFTTEEPPSTPLSLLSAGLASIVNLDFWRQLRTEEQIDRWLGLKGKPYLGSELSAFDRLINVASRPRSKRQMRAHDRIIREITGSKRRVVTAEDYARARDIMKVLIRTQHTPQTSQSIFSALDAITWDIKQNMTAGRRSLRSHCVLLANKLYLMAHLFSTDDDLVTVTVYLRLRRALYKLIEDHYRPV